MCPCPTITTLSPVKKSEFVTNIALFMFNADTLSPPPYYIPSLTILGQCNTPVTSVANVLDLDDDEMQDYLKERACLNQVTIMKPSSRALVNK